MSNIEQPAFAKDSAGEGNFEFRRQRDLPRRHEDAKEHEEREGMSNII